MADPKTQIIQSLLEAPLPSMLERLGFAIASAQLALDKNSIAVAALMGDRANGVSIDGNEYSLLELGFTPTFYAFTETTIDVKLTFNLTEGSELTVGGAIGVNVYFVAALISASYTQKYQFDAHGASEIKSKLVTLPPPSGLTQLLQKRLAERLAQPPEPS